MLPVFQLMQSMAHYIRQTFSLHVQLVAEVKWIQHSYKRFSRRVLHEVCIKTSTV